MNSKIERLKLKYKEVRDKRRIVIRMLQNKQEEEVQKYLEAENKKLYQQELGLKDKIYRKIKKKYSLCDHIWAVSLEIVSGDTKFYDCGCIKCGFDQSIFQCNREEPLSFEEDVMLEFSRENPQYIKFLTADILCDFELGKAIYQKIKEYHPDLDDATVRKYFEIALDDITNIPVSNERKAKRAKRLSLDPNFNKWPTK